MNTVEKTRYANYNISYCFAWKVQRDISDKIAEINEIVEETFQEFSLKEGIAIEDFLVTKEYIKVNVSAIPKLSPSDIASKLKGITGRRIGIYTGINKIWDRGYSCFTKGNIDHKEIIKHL